MLRTLGPELAPGDTVLDLACGDGGLAEFLDGLEYLGVDASTEMVAAGRALGRELVRGDLNDFTPVAPVQATSIFRAIYYAADRPRLFAQIVAYTEKKLVFDLNPRQYRLADVRSELRSAGFDRLDVRPFFVPQTHALPGFAARPLRLLERSGPPARLILKARFTLLCAASRSVVS
ncbi:MAG: class I SAM-dependent methyltransferase [Gaiellaceae bacterium]